MTCFNHDWSAWKTFFVVEDEPPKKGRTLHQSRSCSKCLKVELQEVREEK